MKNRTKREKIIQEFRQSRADGCGIDESSDMALDLAEKIGAPENKAFSWIEREIEENEPEY